MSKELSIIIPVYNEEAVLKQEVERIIEEMQKILPGVEYELLLVENGSYDRTREILAEMILSFPQIRTIHLPKAGYGPALKQGLLESRGSYIVLFNIDFWNVQFIRKALKVIFDKNLDMVIGSKTMPGAEDIRPWLRRIITLFFNSLLRLAFGFRGTDTHGMKLLVRDKIIPIVKTCVTEREIFDTEFVLHAQAAGLTSEEIPVVCQEKRRTTYHIAKRIPRTLKDLVLLYWELRLKARRAGIIYLGLFFVIAIFLITVLWGFPDRPSPWFDSGINLGIAKTFVEDGVYSLRLAPGQFVAERSLMISTNYPLLGFIILSFKLFGVGLAQAQAVMIIFLALFLFLVYRWLSFEESKINAMLGLCLAVTFLPFYGNGLSGGLGEVAGLTYFLAYLLFSNNQKKVTIFLAGIFLGLAAATKVFYLALLVGVGAGEIWQVIKLRRPHIQRWLLLGAGAALPLFFWLFTLYHGSSLAELSKTFDYYHNPYGTETGIVVRNILRFFSGTTPIHFSLLLLAFFAGLYVKRKRLVKNDMVILVFVLLNLVWYLKTPGWYRYLFPSHLLLLVLLPVNLTTIAKALMEKSILRLLTPIFIVILIMVQAVHLFSLRKTKLYYNPVPREAATKIDQMLKDGTDVMVVDHPELWFLLGNKTARQYLNMNPHVAFGNDFLNFGSKPKAVILGANPEDDLYVRQHLALFNQYYSLFSKTGNYDIYILK